MLKWGFSELTQQFPVGQVPQTVKNQLYATAKPLRPQYWRMMAPWNLIAVTKDPAGTRDWSPIDSCINDILLQLTGVQIILMIGQGRPGWVSYGDAASYGDFCAEVATRYKPGGVGIRTDGIYAANAGKGVTHFECWNEENQATFWGGAPDAATYVAYLKQCYTKIKAVTGLSGSNSKILFGGFQHLERNQWANLWTWAGIPEITFLTQCYDAEANLHNWFDVMTEHIYPQVDTQSYNGSTPGPAPNSTIDNLLQLVAIHNLLVSKGATRDIWITEVNYWTLGITETQARDYLEDLFTYLDGLTYVPVVVIYNVRDTAPNSNRVEDNCGVVKNDFTHKLVYDWLKTFSPTTGGGGTPMSASATNVGITTTADMYVRIKAQMRMGQKLTATTNLGMTTTAGIVNPGGHMVGTSSTGITTTASMVIKGITGSTSIGMTGTADFSVLTLVGSTSVGIQT